MTQVKHRSEATTAERGEVALSAPLKGNAQAFDPVIQMAHWVTVILILAVFITAALMDVVPSPWRSFLLQIHRSFGLTIWVMTVLRLSWRQFARLPEWPEEMNRAERGAARVVEYLLYGLLLLQPALGFLHANAHGFGVTVFFLFKIPRLIGEDHELADMLIGAHAVVANLLLIVIALHATAALFHHFVRGDSVLRRMLPSAPTSRG